MSAIRNALDIKPELIKSGGGAFEVRVDDDLIYSKLATGEFPTNDAIVEMLSTRGA